jgi:hypothetical protein
MKQLGFIAGAVLSALLIACSNLELPKRVVGTLAHHGDPIQIIAPHVVNRGEDFKVEITTYGGGCLKKGASKVELEGSKADIKPYDLDTSVSLPNYGCTMELIPYTHTVELRFEEAGEAQLRIFGLRKDASNPQGTPITVTRTLEVR